MEEEKRKSEVIREKKEMSKNTVMNKRRTGTYYEDLAAHFLEEYGYQILQRSFRCHQGEIDIVAKDGEYLVFVEVKFRSGRRYGRPEEAVNLKKQRVISKVARYYLYSHGHNMNYTSFRFDLVAIEGKDIRLYKNAFPYRF